MSLRRANREECSYKIKEFLEHKDVEGIIVLLDRFIDSTLVYQGAIGGIESSTIIGMSKLAWDIVPDCTILLDKEPTTTISRVLSRDEHRDGCAIDVSYISRAKKAFKVIGEKMGGNRIFLKNNEPYELRAIVNRIVRNESNGT